MEQKMIFRERLEELMKLADDCGRILSEEEVREELEDLPLSESHLESVFSYLKEKGILIASSREEAEQARELGRKDAISYYMDDLERICKNALDALQTGEPLFSADRELELFRQAASGSREAVEILSEAYLPMVCQIVEEYETEDLAREDLIQEGNVGLLTAITTIRDIENVAACQAQVFNGIHQALRDAAAAGQAYRETGQKVADQANRLQDAAKGLKEELGRVPSPEELSAFLDIPVERIRDILRMTGENLF